jgi:hypothetical protein
VRERCSPCSRRQHSRHRSPAALLPEPGVILGLTVEFEIPDRDVHHTRCEIAHKGAHLFHPPSKFFWGYGAELSDQNGCLARLWDEKSMKERG